MKIGYELDYDKIDNLRVPAVDIDSVLSKPSLREEVERETTGAKIME
jgi:hypothetical protein